MEKSLELSPVEMLKRMVAEAFPDRHDILSLEVDGSYAHAWQKLARFLSIDESALDRKLAPLFGIELAGSLDAAESAALTLVPSAFCQENGVLPLRIEQGKLIVATANPFDSNISERLHFLANRPPRFVLASPASLADAIVNAYSREAYQAATAVGGVRLAGHLLPDDVLNAPKANAIVKLARELLTAAIEQRASDLHLQPYLGSAIVRIRVDGVLRRLTMLPDAVATTLIRHIKAKAGMDSTNSLIPQDGRMSVVYEGRDFDLRVSVLPASRGERLISRPSGLLIFTGPTGSGKTSTLYSMLAELNRSSVNIITIENPVEYLMPGISQVEVNEKSGRSFGAALRSILRQDPDIILIGEIRDRETAEIAIQESLTGHLVLTTLHTNDAVTAIPRLLDLGIQPSILADALAAVIPQRLCHSLCPSCRTPVSEPLTAEEAAFVEVTNNRPGHRAVGCEQCGHTGYLGRLPIIEIIEVQSRLREAIVAGESSLSVLEGLRDGGLKSLAASAALRIISGDTTVREALNVIGQGFWAKLAGHYGSPVAIDDLVIYSQHAADSPGIVVISQNAQLLPELEPALVEAGYRVVGAASPETANALLKQDEELTFVIMDIADGATLDGAAADLSAARLAIAWCRLPAIVLLPAELAGAEEALHERGMLSPCLAKPIDVPSLIKHIRQRQAY